MKNFLKSSNSSDCRPDFGSFGPARIWTYGATHPYCYDILGPKLHIFR